jgi:hypothetical protein
MFGKTMMRCLLAVALVASAVAAQADTINLATGWNINWNIDTSPTLSPNQDIQIVSGNNGGTSATSAIFGGYDLGIGFSLASGAGGQIAVNSFTNPTATWAFDPSSGFPPAGTGPFSSPIEQIYISNTSNSGGAYSVPTTPVSLVTLNFKPGSTAPAAGSVFDVWGIGGATAGGDADWLDSQGNSYNYGNTGSAVNGANGDVLLGTITITGTVTPEPSSLVLLGVAGLGLVFYRARRRVCGRDALVG